MRSDASRPDGAILNVSEDSVIAKGSRVVNPVEAWTFTTIRFRFPWWGGYSLGLVVNGVPQVIRTSHNTLVALTVASQGPSLFSRVKVYDHRVILQSLVGVELGTVDDGAKAVRRPGWAAPPLMPFYPISLPIIPSTDRLIWPNEHRSLSLL